MSNEAPAPYTSALIVAQPTVEDPINQLSSEDQAHITLTFFGEAADLPSALQDDLVEAVDAIAGFQAPFSVRVSGTATIGPDHAKVVLVESEELVRVRNHLLALPPVAAAMAMCDKQFPWWLPHLTIGYDEDMPAEITDIEEIAIGGLGLWLAGEKDFSPFSESAVDDELQDITASVAIPEVRSIEDLPMAMAYASAVPQAQWYVRKRAQALGLADRLPEQWSRG